MASTAGVDRETSEGYGWVLFAGTMLALAGTLNTIYGIAAIDDSKFYTPNAEYVISSLNTWGWTLLVIGVVQILSAVGIWMQSPGARWVGIVSAGVNAVIQMIFIPAFPLLSLALFAVDILIIYGLLAYGRRPATR